MNLIIDGYNVMKAAKAFKLPSFQAEREAFIDRIVEYRMRGGTHDVTVVFDGSKSQEKFPQATNIRGVRVIFSAQGESADEIIVRLVRQSSRPKDLLVVTSDREIQQAARAQGATIASAADMVEKIMTPKVERTDINGATYMEEQVKGYRGELASSRKKKGSSKQPKKNRARNKLWKSK